MFSRRIVTVDWTRLDDRLMREVDIMQRLRHPNIIRLVEALDTPEQVNERMRMPSRSCGNEFCLYVEVLLLQVRRDMLLVALQHSPGRTGSGGVASDRSTVQDSSSVLD